MSDFEEMYETFLSELYYENFASDFQKENPEAYEEGFQHFLFMYGHHPETV